MDWATWNHQPPARREAPGPELLETCWQVRSEHTGRLITCAIYRDRAPGVELRAGFSADDVLRSARQASIEAARATAGEWLDGVRAKGGFEIVEP